MSLEHQLELIGSRAERFRQLKEAYSNGEFSIKSTFESNDFFSLRDNLYSNGWKDMEIPQDLKEEAIWVLKETEKLGFGLMKSPSEEERRQNQKRYVEYFERSEGVERKLYQIISDYKDKHPESETQN